jgi:uncharacterized hydrophobic protein (TIGR00271 family)
MRLLIDVSRQQRLAVNEALSQGSSPRTAFFGMVALSSLIAGLGLIMDSTAIVIGAMLVAPLMTPILGISLAMVRRDPVLLGIAVRSELAGAGIAVLAALLLGVLIPYFEATPEMLSRTLPNLLDLAVALLAGAAGAYALVDERLSPALPGVAISTAIVPPLANAGLCVSLGAYQGAWGSFMLFMTNFVSILLSAALVFLVSGFGQVRQRAKGVKLGTRLAATALSVFAVGAFLAVELSEVIERRRLQSEIRVTLRDELPRYRVSEVLRLRHFKMDDQIVVIAHVLAPLVVQPRAVKDIELGLEARLGRAFQLVVHTSLTEGVSATGTMRRVVSQTLDGLSLSEVSEEAEQVQQAEQIIREYLGGKVGIRLEGIDRPPLRGERLGTASFIAEIDGLRELRLSEVREIDALLKSRLGADARIAVRQDKHSLMDREGPLRWELTRRRKTTQEYRDQRSSIRRIAAETLAERDAVIVAASFTVLEDGHHAFFEIAGPRAPSPSDVEAIEERIRSRLGIPCRVLVRPVPDSVVSSAGYTTWDAALTEFGTRTREFYAEETEQILRDWR